MLMTTTSVKRGHELKNKTTKKEGRGIWQCLEGGKSRQKLYNYTTISKRKEKQVLCILDNSPLSNIFSKYFLPIYPDSRYLDKPFIEQGGFLS